MRVAVESGEIEVADTGAGAGNPALVLLHAFALAKEVWEPQVGALAGLARIVRLDMRGMGRSSVTPGPYPTDLLARDVLAVADALRLERFVLVGHSYTTPVALDVHRQARERITGLALVAGTGDSPDAESTGQMLDAVDAIEAYGMKAVAAAFGDAYVGKSARRENPEIWEHVRSMMLASDKDGAAATMSGMAMRTSLTGEYRRIAVPTRIVAGSEDVIAPLETLRATASRIAGAVLDEVRSGHVPSLEAPEATTQVLRSLLAAAG